MTTGTGPLFRLDGPLPLPRRFTLLDVAQSVDLGMEGHWLNGVWMQGYPQDPVQTNDPCAPGTEKIKDPGGAISKPIFPSFTAYLAETCTAIVVGDDADEWFTARAGAAFKVAEDAAVERVLATGDGLPSWVTGPVPHLTDGNLDQLDGGAAVSAKHGLEDLEDAIGATSRGGLIHATPATVTAWESYGSLLYIDRAGYLRTQAAGTLVVVGDGYLGAYPDGGSAPGTRQAWAFATGMVRYLSDPVRGLPPRLVAPTYAESLDRGSNTVTYRAERDYVVMFDSDTNNGDPYPPLQAGVLIDRSIATP